MSNTVETYVGTQKVGADGRISIPADIRNSLDVKPGDKILVEFRNKIITIKTIEVK